MSAAQEVLTFVQSPDVTAHLPGVQQLKHEKSKSDFLMRNSKKKKKEKSRRKVEKEETKTSAFYWHSFFHFLSKSSSCKCLPIFYLSLLFSFPTLPFTFTVKKMSRHKKYFQPRPGLSFFFSPTLMIIIYVTVTMLIAILFLLFLRCGCWRYGCLCCRCCASFLM